MQGRTLFIFSILVGSYSYLIFFIGLLGLLNEIVITFCTLVFTIAVLITVKSSILNLNIYEFTKKKKVLLTLFILAISVNLIGAFGPEFGFDALWYHLTLPKLYLESGGIEFIKGSLLYYSLTPKLVDMLYVPALFFGNEITTKLIHFLFGVLVSVATFNIARLFVDRKLALLAAIIFYTNLVVGWLSITAYIDLGRAFFSSLAILFFLYYSKKGEIKYLVICSIFVGLEISTKLLGFSTLIAIVFLILVYEGNFAKKIKNSLAVVVISSIIFFPWLIFSFINSGSVVHPFFTSLHPIEYDLSILNPLEFIKSGTSFLLFSADPISPIYIISIPLIFLTYKRMNRNARMVITFFAINFLLLHFIPQGNARFIVPYLSTASVIVVLALSLVRNRKIKKIFLMTIYITIVINIFYRGIANYKYIPVLTGSESREDFLINNLNFRFGDFIDVEDKIKKIVGENKVLIYDIHNLYYVDFNFDHESWAKDNNYKYVLRREGKALENQELIFSDPITNVRLYESN